MFENNSFVGWEEETFRLEIDLIMVDPGEPMLMPSLTQDGHPGCPPTFDIDGIRLSRQETPLFGSLETITLTLNEKEFSTFFENGADAINNAFEWASEQEVLPDV